MPAKPQLLRLIVFIFVLIIGNGFRNLSRADGNDNDKTSNDDTFRITKHSDDPTAADALKGAWMLKGTTGEEVLVFVDNYFSQTHYSLVGKKFISTRGGTYTVNGDKLTIKFEFGAPDNTLVGTSATTGWSVKGNKLTLDISIPTAAGTGPAAAENPVMGDVRGDYLRMDDGNGALAGYWQITGRMQGDKMNEMKPGARKTVKILSGSRFQWAAINTETKEFFGTGGGNYSFQDGKYIENIEFFSRDSSRVGASLNFEGSVENGKWIHKGLSSRGEKIHEVWSRSVQP